MTVEDRLRAVLGGEVEISDLARLTGGANRETWAFAADGRPLVARIGGMPFETAALSAARRAGVPEPEVVA